MSENPNKQIKIFRDLSEDLLVDVSSFLPIQSLLQSRTWSKAFRNTKIKSLELDFSGLHSVRRRQSDVVGIINNVMNNHVGTEIRRFACRLNHIGVEGDIFSWINMCIAKNIQELELDFSKSKRVLMIPIDFSAIKTLRVLKLQWCKFELLDSSPSGLNHLRKLSLRRTTQLSVPMFYEFIADCIHLESLEIIECPLLGPLYINAHNHKQFKSLVVSSLPTLLPIIVDAPTLECYKYEGCIKTMAFLGSTNALKEAEVHYNHNFRCKDRSHIVVANMEAYTNLSLLSTTTIFLEALKYRYVGGEHLRKTGSFYMFNNMTTFQIEFKAPTTCTIFDIAEFLKMCPNLEQIVIDINDFRFERNMFWEIHYKFHVPNEIYPLNSLREVKIYGFKGAWHEFDIVMFFLTKAASMEKLVLERPRNQKIKLDEQYDAQIDYIKNMSPRPELTIEVP